MKKTAIDAMDIQILNLLLGNGYMPNNAIANEIGLSEPPTLVRMQRLRENGFLKGFKPIIDLNALGYTFQAAIIVRAIKEETEELYRRILGERQVISCFSLSEGRALGLDWLYFKLATKSEEEVEITMERLLKGLDIFFLEVFTSVKPIKLSGFYLLSEDMVR